jgi:hypothetical protein
MSSRGKGIRIRSRKPARAKRVVAVAAPPEAVVHIRIYFPNKDRSRFISIGYYPDRKYEPYDEIGGVKCGVILSAYYLTSLVNHLPKLAEHLSKNQAHRCDEETFHLRLLDGKRSVTFQCDGLRISIGENVNFLLSNSTVLLYQLGRYVFTTSDVQCYAAKCTNSSSFVHPGDSVSQFVLYDLICDELNSSLVSVPKM